MMESPNLTPIQNFYKDSVVFLTGCTGLLGQLALEKLLRSCPDVSKVFVLIRSKKQKDAQTRLEDEIFNSVTFELLRKQYPDFKNKVVAISGDCELPGLGISAEDRKILIEQVTIVFHLAASMHFDNKLASAIKTNIRGALHCILLAKEMHHLQAMLHTSTIFCQCLDEIIEEKIGKPAFDYKQLICLSENLSKNLLDEITPRLVGKYINPYAFTKQVAEDVIQQNGPGLPMGIFRPAVVTNTYLEPIKGWSNNMHGPLGIIRSSLLGFVRIVHVDPTLNANLVPADMCANAIIATAWDISMRFKQNHSGREIPVYNYESQNTNPISWGYFKEAVDKHALLYPSIKAMWYPVFILSNNVLKYHILNVLLHLVPAFFQDILLVLKGTKPTTLRQYLKLNYITELIIAFTRRNWICRTENTEKVISRMSEKDRKTFYMDTSEINWKEYFKSLVFGVRVYLSRDPLETLNAAKLKMKKLYWVHQITKMAATFFLLYLFWILVGFLW